MYTLINRQRSRPSTLYASLHKNPSHNLKRNPTSTLKRRYFEPNAEPVTNINKTTSAIPAKPARISPYATYAKELPRSITGVDYELKVPEGRLTYQIFDYQGVKMLDLANFVSNSDTKSSGVLLMKKVLEIGKAAGCNMVRLVAETSDWRNRLTQTELLNWYQKRGFNIVKPGGNFGRWMVGEIDECLELIDKTIRRWD